MNKYQLLILGNGFDLHCGLKSRYKDFFRSCILDTISEPFEIIQLQAGVSGFWEGLLLIYYRFYGGIDYNWCDIETIIKNTLWLICYGENERSTSLNNGIWRRALEGAKIGNYPADVASRNQIISFISKYCAEFFLRKNSILDSGNDSDKLYLLLTNLLKELNNFEKRFCKFLKDQIINPQNKEQIKEDYFINFVNLLAKLTNFIDTEIESIDEIIDKQEEERVRAEFFDIEFNYKPKLFKVFNNLCDTYILSFNYTMIFDILDVESPCVYGNVHGKLCSKRCNCDCDSSSVIFGIDDNLIQSQDSDTDLRLFSKTYRKMHNTGVPINILPPNDESVEIIFYGHSLSEADYSYFQSIFDYYDLYGNNNVSLVFNYSKGHEQTDAIYKLISSYGKTLINREQGKNLIHKLILENRLRIEEI